MPRFASRPDRPQTVITVLPAGWALQQLDYSPQS